MHPEQFAPFFFLLIVAVILKVVLGSGLGGRGAKEVPYERRSGLFTASERSFLGVLEQIFRHEYRVMGKVRLGDIIRAPRGLSNSARASANNKIDRKHVDFVLCDPRTLQVIGVIELDDSSHDWSARQSRDQFVDAALASAGVPFVHIPTQRGYAPADVRERIAVLFNGEWGVS